MAPSSCALHLHSAMARGGMAFAGRMSSRSVSLAATATVTAPRACLPRFSGLSRSVTFARPGPRHAVIEQPRLQGHHECPHWLNPQAAWKQVSQSLL